MLPLNCKTGDIIVYRPKGNAAGGAAFTKFDRSELKRLLKAVKTAELWHKEEEEWNNLVTRNVSRDPAVKPWVDETRTKLLKVGILTVKDLRQKLKLGNLNDLLKEVGEAPISAYIVQLMDECANSLALNTGHIVFASGPAEIKGENEYRIRVVHSTKYGRTDRRGNTTEGVQEYFRRFRLVVGPNGEERWTREMKEAPVEDGPNDEGETEDEDFDEDDDDPNHLNMTDQEMEEAAGDEMAGAVNVEVLAARMCF
jgi:hypothetical protein